MKKWNDFNAEADELFIIFPSSGINIFSYISDPWYMEVGESIINSLNYYTKVDGGFASIRDVTTMQQEDHQHSFFLSETLVILCLLIRESKYIYIYMKMGTFVVGMLRHHEITLPLILSGVNIFIFYLMIHFWPIKIIYLLLRVTLFL